jgi:hypothetical protein
LDKTYCVRETQRARRTAEIDSNPLRLWLVQVRKIGRVKVRAKITAFLDLWIGTGRV